jgi:hypothetical protein
MLAWACLTFFRIWNFLIAFFTPFITSSIDFRYGYVFAAANFLGFLVVYFFVIESKGRSLEEIDEMYVNEVNPRHSTELSKLAPGSTTAAVQPLDEADAFSTVPMERASISTTHGSSTTLEVEA